MIKIYSIDGKVIIEKTYKNTNEALQTLQVAALEPRLYYLLIVVDGTVEKKSFVKP